MQVPFQKITPYNNIITLKKLVTVPIQPYANTYTHNNKKTDYPYILILRHAVNVNVYTINYISLYVRLENTCK